MLHHGHCRMSETFLRFMWCCMPINWGIGYTIRNGVNNWHSIHQGIKINSVSVIIYHPESPRYREISEHISKNDISTLLYSRKTILLKDRYSHMIFNLITIYFDIKFLVFNKFTFHCSSPCIFHLFIIFLCITVWKIVSLVCRILELKVGVIDQNYLS